MFSYQVLKPIRDALGTVYGADKLEHLFTATFVGTLVVAPIYAWIAAHIKLKTLIPWVYGFLVVNILIFYALFEANPESRMLAAAFYVWLSVANMFVISVFWSFMSDVWSKEQSKRLFGFIAAGGSVGAAVGPAITAAIVTMVGTGTMMLVSAVGFGLTIIITRILVSEKEESLAEGGRDALAAQPTSLNRKLGGNPLAGFSLLLKTPYLLLIAAFILFMTWISTIVYFQQAAFISKAFASKEARTQAFALVELIVNIGAIAIQLFGTSRLVSRFGVTTGLLFNPILMVFSFIAVALSPMLMVLLSVQVIRRISEYAVARPSREMLFTVVDQETKYKAKSVIDTVVYRAGDLSAAWAQAGLAALGWGVAAVAMFGAAVAAIWGVIAWSLGHRFERIRVDQHDHTAPAA
jgi:AAA family ATP:ADP antiporter